MKKKLAIFCDGTWNDLSLDNSTNVVRLARCVASESESGHPQIVYYDEGVGVGSNVSFVTDKLTKVLGGAFGRGLDRKIEAAYRFLVLNYWPGDDIYIFGFSRGAYTARSLCGLIRKCGILRRDCFNKAPEALERYRDKSHPKSPEMIEFRNLYAHPVAAGDEDHARMGIEGYREYFEPRREDTLEDLYQFRDQRTYRMMYVGLWDTVGAMGIPAPLDVLGLNSRYAFHNTDASTLMSSIRHAVASNEKRGLFDVTPISNIIDLNRHWARHVGWNVDERNVGNFVPYRYRPYQQKWFPGDHCSVGGGHEEVGLSSAALLWIAEGAAWAGLGFNLGQAGELDDALAKANSCADLGAKASARFPGGRKRRRGDTWPGGEKRCRGAMHAGEIADSTWDRALRRPEFRPPNLTVMAGLWDSGVFREPPPDPFPYLRRDLSPPY